MNSPGSPGSPGSGSRTIQSGKSISPFRGSVLTFRTVPDGMGESGNYLPGWRAPVSPARLPFVAPPSSQGW